MHGTARRRAMRLRIVNLDLSPVRLNASFSQRTSWKQKMTEYSSPACISSQVVLASVKVYYVLQSALRTDCKHAPLKDRRWPRCQAVWVSGRSRGIRTLGRARQGMLEPLGELCCSWMHRSRCRCQKMRRTTAWQSATLSR